ncbi:hypothetical protein ElyMa_006242500, partial [Elysia marginata]
RATLTVRVPFKLRLVEENFSSALEDPDSAEYRQLATNLETQLTPILERDVPDFVGVAVTGFRKDNLFDLSDLLAAWQSEPITSGGGGGGASTTKRSTDVNRNNGDNDGDDDDDDDLGEVEIIIIAVAAALVFVAFTVIIFKLWESNKSKSPPKSRLSNSSGSSTPSDRNGSGSTSTDFSDLKKSRPPTKFSNQYHQPQENIYQPAYDNPGYAAPDKSDTNSVTYAAYIP